MDKIAALQELYTSISDKLKIVPFANESSASHRFRLVYSAMGRWIIQLFADRDFEQEDDEEITKTHVTLSSLEILQTYVQLDEDLHPFFVDEKKLVQQIQDIYVNIGYIVSGKYVYKYPKTRQIIDMGAKCLIINPDTKVKRTVGLGVLGTTKKDGISLEKYLLAKIDAHTYFNNIIGQLKFASFSPYYGKIEMYNIESKRWDVFNEKLAHKYPYSIIKIDEGLDYQIIKTNDGILYAGKLPQIYSKADTDVNFRYEIWRVIIGMCAYNKNPCKVIVRPYCGDGVEFTTAGFIFPFQEYSLLRTISWPKNKATSYFEFVTYSEYLETIKQIFIHMSLEIIEEKET